MVPAYGYYYNIFLLKALILLNGLFSVFIKISIVPQSSIFRSLQLPSFNTCITNSLSIDEYFVDVLLVLIS
jgi:hypothetical protein